MAKPSKEKEFFTQRDILWYLVFAGFAINYMLRVNINVAIVSMVRTKSKTVINPDSECLRENLTTILPITEGNFNVTEPYTTNQPTTTGKSPFAAKESDSVAEDDTFPWDVNQQNRILGAFFWLHWLTQIPGGILAGKYGTKFVFGVSNFVAILISFFIPWACYLGEYYLIAIRVIQGLVAGFAWPSMHNMTAKWVPPNERSKFVTAYLGSSVGAGVTFPMCGYIIHWLGWKWVFYISGIVGCLWYMAWFFLVYDSPNDHPRISEKERLYITESLGNTVSKGKQQSIPWIKLITSRYVLLNVLAQWGGIWGVFTTMTHGPTYLKMIHGWNITATGLLSGLPHFVRVVWAYVFSMFGDYLLRSNKMNRTNVRKLATFFCTTIQGLFMLGLAYSGCDKALAVFFLTASTGVNGAVSTGPLASFVDLSPNNASIMLGIANTVGACCGFMTPAVVAYFTSQNQSVGQWQKVFWVATVQLVVVGLLYISFAKSELQPWNSPKEEKHDEKEAEMKPLKSNDENTK